MPAPAPHTRARLALADGQVFAGDAFGHTGPATVAAEVCFNTSMSGYQEVLTDASYAGQIVVMTTPMIGNYGVNVEDLESDRVQVSGFVVRENSPTQSSFRSETSLHAFLAERGVIGLTGVDTRAITKTLRVDGALNGVISTDPATHDAALVAAARAAPGLVGRNLVAGVSRGQALRWEEDLGRWLPVQGRVPAASPRKTVVAIDCGAKLNILRHLVDRGCDVTVVPHDTPAAAILERKPDGLFVSNGPGDPAAVTPTTETLGALHGRVPTFGICLGHQLLAIAAGATTSKLKFGHRGGNQPVQNLGTGKVEITSQNHGFAVDRESLAARGAEPTHVNLNDRTLEGFRHAEEAVFAVQYHPEASPGPHDARYLFDCFIEMMDSGRSPDAEAMDRAQRRRNRPGDTAA
ncbi:glutamine-hydrolyzing carbamoyl-phosphate synthase small subunit [Phycisphaera mikurensis]|uniref:Carbamoyl phosphate synthase small chain n=1 Tax=Phycisphaera mikurensis (strain NBRC 102666 / KCTC 22515 / FYK2301M01) TaxID=1142394 RepID=I0IBJ8_PHYMF|nr:glutamine-hydrolyzing carbamoyl-phosphate synthase small subunit [Phycisphaera mikurensis]MBB6442834.1 carbamoyl-phosphate synthase small subunit [Phycisphaera mikurensis]BAM02636.1 carbamoyl-phosphate synthase small chain [Phycisphaera mikurensis NBRC 102666]